MIIKGTLFIVPDERVIGADAGSGSRSSADICAGQFETCPLVYTSKGVVSVEEKGRRIGASVIKLLSSLGV